MLRPLRHISIRRVAVFSLLFALCILAPTGFPKAQANTESAPLVTAIEFSPTQYLTAEDMLSVMKETKVGRPLDPDKLMADLWAIHALGTERHKEQVFYDFEAEFVPHGDGVKVVVHPIEMPTIAGFAVDIDAVNEDAFFKQFDIKPGQILNVEALHAAIDKARDGLFNTTGHFFYLRDLSMDDQDVVHIELRAVRVASVQIEGNEKTREYVIQREIQAEPGTPLDVRQVNSDVRRIFQLRHFNDVSADLLERPDDPLKVDIVYHVDERQTGMAGFGAGYSSVDKLVGYLELADENLFGRGQYGAVRWEFGTNKTSYDLSFHEPNIGGSRIAAGFGLYNRTLKSTTRYDEPHTQHDIGGNVTLGKRFTDFLQGSLRLRITNTEKTYDDTTKPVETNRTRSIRLNLSGDTTDQPFYPTSGMRYGASTEVAMAILGGDTQFTKYEANWSTYKKVGSNGQVIAARLMGGISPDSLPSEDLFRVGGPDTVRGYNYGTMRGDKMVVANAEYRFKLSDSVQGVVFADAGNAWDASDKGKLSDLSTSVGLGVRFETPIGLMRLDYGIGQNGGRIDFSIGPSF